MSGSSRYHHRRPYAQHVYDEVRADLISAPPRAGGHLTPEGITIDLVPSDVLRLTLVEGAQIIHLFAWNRDDPDERIWTNETSSKENAFLVRDHRIWGTMARFRPLLTVVEDSLTDARQAGRAIGPHHFVLGGRETPVAWTSAGGDPAVPTPWDRFRALLDRRGVDPRVYRDHVSLFQRIDVDVETQRFDVVPSEASVGDRMSLFAEIGLTVALVPCPSREGGTDPRTLDGSVRAVGWEVIPTHVAAPGWPYPDVPYPDLAPYLDSTGSRA